MKYEISKENCNHQWTVFSTALEDHCLMLVCDLCKSYGTVDDPTREEWRAGFYAPSNPYRWSDNKRVTTRAPSTDGYYMGAYK